MLRLTVYPIVAMLLWAAALTFVALMIVRMLFSYTDPNPFSSIGRLAYKLRKTTARFVDPAARMLSNFRLDARLAPLVTILITLVLTYFVSRMIGDLFFIVDGLSAGVIGGDPAMFIGFVLYAVLSVLTLFILLRFLASWFVFGRKPFFGFVQRVTDPILLPVRRVIPPLGMFDLSAMIVLIGLGLLQSVVLRLFVFR